MFHLHHALRLIFPSWCELCDDASEHAVCSSCEEGLIRMDAPFCLRCSEKFDGAAGSPRDCYHCRDLKFSFEFVVTAYQMNEGMRTLVHALKYKKALYLDQFLGRCLRSVFLDDRIATLNLSEWVITAVPLHFSRQRQRYFNQSEILAKTLASETGMRYLSLLKRVRPTRQQIRLTKPERAKNVAGAFANNEESPCENVILVDDVFTTGATVNECAKQLKKQGVKRVIVVCLARK